MEKREFNIRYEVIGRRDGLWTVQAYDSQDKPLGAKVECLLPSEAWKVFFMLNGMGVADSPADETTETIYVEAPKAA